MPNPTIVGTASTPEYDSSDTTGTISLTIPAGATAVVAFCAGFDNTTVSSVTLDGNAMENVVSGQNGSNQFGGLFYMDDQDANWPGTGTFNVVGTIGAAEQFHLHAVCFQDVDTATAGYRSAASASGNDDDPSVSLTGMTSSTDTMVLGTCFYENENATATSGTLITETDNGAGGSNTFFSYDNAPGGASASIGITTDAAVDHWSGAFALIGTSSGTTVNANTDALTLTEQAASIALDVNVSTVVDALTLTEQAASVSSDVVVNAAVDALTLTESAATITFDVNVQASVDALTLTELQASLSANTEVQANTDALTLTELQSGITFDVNIGAAVDALTLTEHQADAGISSVTVTDVNTTESWADGATGLVATGTGFV